MTRRATVSARTAGPAGGSADGRRANVFVGAAAGPEGHMCGYDETPRKSYTTDTRYRHAGTGNVAPHPVPFMNPICLANNVRQIWSLHIQKLVHRDVCAVRVIMCVPPPPARRATHCGTSNRRWIVVVKRACILHDHGVVVAWDGAPATVYDAMFQPLIAAFQDELHARFSMFCERAARK